MPTPTYPVRSPSGQTASTLVLVGLVLQVIGGLFLLGGIAFLFGFSLLHPYPFWGAALAGGAGVAAIVIVFLYCAYTYAYQPIQRGDYARAQGPTLVLGILSLFLGVIPGIFYLIAYVKLGDAVREGAGYGWGSPAGYAAPSIACVGCGRISPAGAFAFCPGCGRKLGP
jgi:hypothetical protein